MIWHIFFSLVLKKVFYHLKERKSMHPPAGFETTSSWAGETAIISQHALDLSATKCTDVQINLNSEV